jgi:hypothetical protein
MAASSHNVKTLGLALADVATQAIPITATRLKSTRSRGQGGLELWHGVVRCCHSSQMMNIRTKQNDIRQSITKNLL